MVVEQDHGSESGLTDPDSAAPDAEDPAEGDERRERKTTGERGKLQEREGTAR